MESVPIYPIGVSKGNLRYTPIGVMIIYQADEMDELEHLVVFLRSYFAITDADIANKRKGVRFRKEHPHIALGGPISLLQLIRRLPQLSNEGHGVAIGFFYPDKKTQKKTDHVTVFHEYKKHLDADTTLELDHVRVCYSEIEEEYFPTRNKLH